LNMKLLKLYIRGYNSPQHKFGYRRLCNINVLFVLQFEHTVNFVSNYRLTSHF